MTADYRTRLTGFSHKQFLIFMTRRRIPFKGVFFCTENVLFMHNFSAYKDENTTE